MPSAIPAFAARHRPRGNLLPLRGFFSLGEIALSLVH